MAGNDSPHLTAIADQRVLMNGVLGPVAFFATDDETPSDDLTYEVTSSNPLLLPQGSIVLGGVGASRTLSARPAKNVSGTATLLVKARDPEGLESSTAFLLSVERTNAPPRISAPPELITTEGADPSSIAFTVADPDGAAELLRIEAATSNPILLAPASLQLFGTSETRRLIASPTPSASGTADRGWTFWRG